MTLYRFIDAERAHTPIRLLCRTLGVARSAFYAWRHGGPSRRDQEATRLAVHIRAIHRRSRGTYGSPRVHAALLQQGLPVGRKRVARLMASLGLSGTPKRRFRRSVAGASTNVAENLLKRDFTTDAPNRAWVTDITYLHTSVGFVYLAVVIDLFSRKVVGWSLASHMRTELCLAALARAIAARMPQRGLVHHSDRGCQYTSAEYQRALQARGLVASMSRKGNCWDNAVAESFFGTLEHELVKQSTMWADAVEARAAVSDYIHGFYNAERLHSRLGYRSPVAFEETHQRVQVAAK